MIEGAAWIGELNDSTLAASLDQSEELRRSVSFACPTKVLEGLVKESAAAAKERGGGHSDESDEGESHLEEDVDDEGGEDRHDDVRGGHAGHRGCRGVRGGGGRLGSRGGSGGGGGGGVSDLEFSDDEDIGAAALKPSSGSKGKRKHRVMSSDSEDSDT